MFKKKSHKNISKSSKNLNFQQQKKEHEIVRINHKFSKALAPQDERDGAKRYPLRVFWYELIMDIL